MISGHLILPAVRRKVRGSLALFLSVTFAAIFMLSSAVFAQETGQIAGTVTDSTGAAVSNAVVEVKNLGTNAVRETTTTATGGYLVTGLAPATYELTAKASGFNSYISKIEITVGGKLNVDVRLTVGATTTSVEVSAADGGVQINTTTQELSQVVDSQQISQLPSLTRNPTTSLRYLETFLLAIRAKAARRRTRRLAASASTSMASAPREPRFCWMALRMSASSVMVSAFWFQSIACRSTGLSPATSSRSTDAPRAVS